LCGHITDTSSLLLRAREKRGGKKGQKEKRNRKSAGPISYRKHAPRPGRRLLYLLRPEKDSPENGANRRSTSATEGPRPAGEKPKTEGKRRSLLPQPGLAGHPPRKKKLFIQKGTETASAEGGKGEGKERR